MLIEKLQRHFYNKDTGGIEETTVYRISYKSLMVMEESLSYALAKMVMYARYKKLLAN